METNELKFRKIFVVEPSHDLSMAKKYSNRIALLTDGGEKTDELRDKIERGLIDFDPSTDALIPMGKVVSCMIAGIVLSGMFQFHERVMVGVYRGEYYEFAEVNI